VSECISSALTPPPASVADGASEHGQHPHSCGHRRQWGRMGGGSPVHAPPLPACPSSCRQPPFPRAQIRVFVGGMPSNLRSRCRGRDAGRVSAAAAGTPLLEPCPAHPSASPPLAAPARAPCRPSASVRSISMIRKPGRAAPRACAGGGECVDAGGSTACDGRGMCCVCAGGWGGPQHRLNRPGGRKTAAAPPPAPPPPRCRATRSSAVSRPHACGPCASLRPTGWRSATARSRRRAPRRRAGRRRRGPHTALPAMYGAPQPSSAGSPRAPPPAPGPTRGPAASVVLDHMVSSPSCG